ncbi:MAG TPA: APC family permease [Gemmatimonadaceae bacterium]|nr:APC family permease [Gemmatimonadaceae bacterium]
MTTLRRVLTVRDLVLFNLVAVIGLRWLATSAKAGPAAIVLWTLAAAFFFVPQGLAVVELSRRFPEEGGIYAWTKRAFGEGHGFLCGWCYWICNVLYYPNLLISTAVIGTYVFGQGESGLASSWGYVLSVTLGALWLAVALNIVGLAKGRWLQNVGGIGTYVTGIILIGVGLWALLRGVPSANAMPARSFIPDLTDLGSLNLWASIAFAFAGLELSATMGGEVEKPERTLPRSVLLSAPLIASMYILGTGALLWLVPVGELNIVSGFLQGISRGLGDAAPGFFWLAPLAAAAYTLGNIGGVGAWLSGPARVAFVIGLDRYFPPAFGKVHPKWGTPYVAILVQASLATLALLMSVLGRGTSVETVYLVLLDTQLLIYFIPYLYLFASLISHRRQARSQEGRGIGSALLIGGCGAGVTLFAMVVATIPPSGAGHTELFFAKVVGGALFFIAIGGALYWRASSRVPDAA